MQEVLLLYSGKVCVPRRDFKDVLFGAHDTLVGGHFGMSKILARISCFHWKQKVRDVT